MYTKIIYFCYIGTMDTVYTYWHTEKTQRKGESSGEEPGEKIAGIWFL